VARLDAGEQLVGNEVTNPLAPVGESGRLKSWAIEAAVARWRGQLGQPPGRLCGAQAFCCCIVSTAACQSQPGAGRDPQAGAGADRTIDHLASGPCSLGWLAHDFSSRLLGLRLHRAAAGWLAAFFSQYGFRQAILAI
jgi:hypothetical protein